MLTHPMAQRIEHWPLDRLIPYHTKKAIEIESIEARLAELERAAEARR
jgi:hypothetical protein